MHYLVLTGISFALASESVRQKRRPCNQGDLKLVHYMCSVNQKGGVHVHLDVQALVIYSGWSFKLFIEYGLAV